MLIQGTEMGADLKPPSSYGLSTAPQLSTSALKQALHAAAWVAFWIVCSVSIIIVNKHVVSYSGFNFPISLALWHMFLGTVTSRTAIHVLSIPDTIKEHGSRTLNFQVGVIGVLFGLTLVTGNAALQMLTVPTVQMLKVGYLVEYHHHCTRILCIEACFAYVLDTRKKIGLLILLCACLPALQSRR